MVNTTAATGMTKGLPLASLNHISIVCRSVEESLHFYADFLGFVPIRHPVSFDFDGAWAICLLKTKGAVMLIHLNSAIGCFLVCLKGLFGVGDDRCSRKSIP